MHSESAQMHPETAQMHPGTAQMHPETAQMHPGTAQMHPEFEGMPFKGFEAKQADTLMLQYPLMFNHSTLTNVSRLNDLLFYANHSLISPDMTQAIYSKNRARPAPPCTSWH